MVKVDKSKRPFDDKRIVMAFFASWALWEKMTFVLALAILGVFGIGYSKLAWQNRIQRKHQLVDEEKRMKIAQLQRSGQYIKVRKSDIVPFGVRAIQSGIRVDGIWVSNPSTPFPRIPKLGTRSRSVDFSSSVLNPPGSVDTSQIAVGGSSRAQSSVRPSFDRSLGSEGDLGGHTLYKPKRSSYLRFGSYGEVHHDEETLDHLEGNTILRKAVARPQTSASLSAFPDTERTSADSTDEILSNNNQLLNVPHRISLPQWSTRASSLLPPPWDTSPMVAQSFNGDYFSIPADSLDEKNPNQYTTAQINLFEAPLSFRAPNAQDIRELTATAAAEVPLFDRTPSPSPLPSPFIPGDLHMNTATRKVNSGFEILPAGTFGQPSTPEDLKGKGIDRDARRGSNEDKRQSKRLQKKTRTSLTSTRNSSAFERP